MRNRKNTIGRNILLVYTRMIVSTLISLFVTKKLIAYVGLENFGSFSVLLAYLGAFYILKSALQKTLTRFVTIGVSDVSKKDNWATYFFISVIFALIVACIVGLVGIILISSILSNNPIIDVHGKYILICIVLEIGLSLIQTALVSRIIAKEDFKVYTYIALIEMLWKPAFLYLVITQGFPPLQTYGIYFLLNTLVPTVIMSVIVFDSEWTPVKWTSIDEFSQIVVHFKWNFLSQMSYVLFERLGLISLASSFGPFVLGTHDLAKRINNYLALITSNAQVVLNPRIIKSSIEADGQMKSLTLLQGMIMSMLIIHVTAVPVVFYSDIIVGYLFPELDIMMSTMFLFFFVIHLYVDSLNASLETFLNTRDRIKGYSSFVTGAMIIGAIVTWFVFRLSLNIYVFATANIVLTVLLLVYRLYEISAELKGVLNNRFVKLGVLLLINILFVVTAFCFKEGNFNYQRSAVIALCYFLLGLYQVRELLRIKMGAL